MIIMVDIVIVIILTTIILLIIIIIINVIPTYISVENGQLLLYVSATTRVPHLSIELYSN